MTLRYSLPLAALLALAVAAPAQAQQYGNGVTLQIPRATGTITLDGDDNEADWATAPMVDLTANWADYSGILDPDISAMGKVLWSDGVLYVHVRYLDFEPLFFGGEFGVGAGEYLLVGVDLLRVNSDSTTGFDGWVENMPDLGPVAYKITGAYGEGSDGITANFNEAPAPVDSGWVAGSVFIDEANFEWGVEMAIYGVQVTEGAQLGFNIGGAAGDDEFAAANQDAYSYFGWQICDPLPDGPDRFCNLEGGAVMSDAGSFATLDLQNTVASEGGAENMSFSLRNASPNPFRGATTLGYDMDRAGTVALSVYDVLGREVAVLNEGARAPGPHTATLDAAALPAGVYVVRMAVDGETVASRQIVRTR